MIRVAVADDQELAREGFALILGAQPDLEVVGTASDGAAAVDLVQRLRPDVILMDVRMPTMDGIAATRQVRGASDTKVLVLTTFHLDEYVYAALRAGASGFLLKDAPRRYLIDAVQTVHRGDVVLDPHVTRRLVQEFLSRAGPSAPSPALRRLSPREKEVLVLVARGLSNAEIAGQLFLAEATVKTHVARVLAKLSLRDRVQAVIFAYENGLTGPNEPG
jgi:DNA-binding NarL/FixJ family response regulator